MPAPTQHYVTNLDAVLTGAKIRIRKKVNPFLAASDTGAAPEVTLPPAPPVGLVYPR